MPTKKYAKKPAAEDLHQKEEEFLNGAAMQSQESQNNNKQSGDAKERVNFEMSKDLYRRMQFAKINMGMKTTRGFMELAVRKLLDEIGG